VVISSASHHTVTVFKSPRFFLSRQSSVVPVYRPLSSIAGREDYSRCMQINDRAWIAFVQCSYNSAAQLWSTSVGQPFLRSSLSIVAILD
jgi:hypothetical protein